MNVLRWRHGLVPLGLGACLAAVGIGTAVADSGILQAPKGVIPADATPFVPKAPPVYPKNADGLTYGSAADAISPDTEPDLILVRADNGKVGYVKRTDLNAVDGDPSNFTSPQQALAWQASNQGKTPQVVVYQLDGHTVVGTFTLGDRLAP